MTDLILKEKIYKLIKNQNQSSIQNLNKMIKKINSK